MCWESQLLQANFLWVILPYSICFGQNMHGYLITLAWIYICNKRFQVRG